jgi:tetratricopeptide (TPR) repeat protein
MVCEHNHNGAVAISSIERRFRKKATAIVHFGLKGDVVHDTHAVESNAAILLAIATKDLKQGRIIRAHTIAKGLHDVEFLRKGEAWVVEASAFTRLLPQESYEKSRQKFLEIVEHDDFRDATLPRASALLGLAWSNIALVNFDQATTSLEEAARIYTTHATKELGYVIELQGVVDAGMSNLEAALRNFKKSKIYSQIDVSGAMQASFDFFERQFDAEVMEDFEVYAGMPLSLLS